MKRYNKIFSLLILCMFALSPVNVFAQPDPCTDPDLPCPIDGGLSFLIAAGIGMGAKKAYQAKKNKIAKF